MRLHAVLAQTKYDLPTLIANSQNFRFLPLIEYYGKNYEIAPNLTPYAKNFLIHEAMRGVKRFEYIENKDTEELVKDSSGLLDFVRCRKFVKLFQN